MSIRSSIAVGIGLALCLPVIGTQVVAHQLRYASWLGKPLLKVGRWALYSPQGYAVWYGKYRWYYPTPFEWGFALMVLWLVLGAVVVGVLLKRSGWQRRRVGAEVDWATARDIRKAGLFVRIRK